MTRSVQTIFFITQKDREPQKVKMNSGIDFNMAVRRAQHYLAIGLYGNGRRRMAANVADVIDTETNLVYATVKVTPSGRIYVDYFQDAREKERKISLYRWEQDFKKYQKETKEVG